MKTDSCEMKVKSALNRCVNEDNLSGDMTQACSLPCVSGKHCDVKYITSDTMCRLLNEEYENEIEDYTIIDCRYPYEYEGGHIEGGINLYETKDITCEFLSNIKHLHNPEKRHVLIFHCEFSSERGPKLARFLRNKDREVNCDNYPNLHYPEIYVLKDGYKNFYEQSPENCVPQTYKPMLHKDHFVDLKYYRAKAKASEKQSRRPASLRGLRFQ
jgi:rhodanese-related sulfurtransferase